MAALIYKQFKTLLSTDFFLSVPRKVKSTLNQCLLSYPGGASSMVQKIRIILSTTKAKEQAWVWVLKYTVQWFSWEYRGPATNARHVTLSSTEIFGRRVQYQQRASDNLPNSRMKFLGLSAEQPIPFSPDHSTWDSPFSAYLSLQYQHCLPWHTMLHLQPCWSFFQTLRILSPPQDTLILLEVTRVP